MPEVVLLRPAMLEGPIVTVPEATLGEPSVNVPPPVPPFTSRVPLPIVVVRPVLVVTVDAVSAHCPRC